MEFHEFAACYPLLEGESLERLAADIRQHGLLEPIVMFKGKVLDGRNRSTACIMADVEPRYREFEGSEEDAMHFVVSHNTHRRHLNKSQLAIAAGKAFEHFERLAKERIRVHGNTAPGQKNNTPGTCNKGVSLTARDDAGKAFGISGSQVQFGRNVVRDAEPELVEAVERGRISVGRASAASKLSAEEQKQVASGKRPAPPRSPSQANEMNKKAEASSANASSPQRKSSLTQNKLDVLITRVEEMRANVSKPSLQVSILDIRRGLEEVYSILKSLNL